MKKFQRILYIPRAEEFFKPLDLNHGGNFKVREGRTSFVCNFQITQQVLPKRRLLAHPVDPALVGLSLHFTFKGLHHVNDSVCRGFKRLFVFHLSDMLWVDTCMTARPVPPEWKIPLVHIFDVSLSG